MKRLLDIKNYVQSIAEAIESVVGVDVTIVDNENIRIAATGKYSDKVGLRVVDKSVFIKSMKNKLSYVVNDPKNEEVCYECENRKLCIEFAEVCSPIIVNDSVQGVIGLVALSENQKLKLMENEENLLEFLKRMGDLLAAKMIEAESIEKEKIILKQIETIINSIDDGIIAFNEHGNVVYVNKKVEEISGPSDKNEFINTIVNQIDFKKILQGKECKNKQLITKKSTMLLNIKPIELDDKIIGCVTLIRTMKEINKIINEVSNHGSYTEFDDIMGISKEIRDVKELAEKAARGDSTILVTGESGTGKEMFARAIHNASHRREKPFIAINCAAIPESLLESELFGYEEGSFTGAKKGGKIGKFELASGGTIFLDEIGDMPLHLQTKLLRVIQERVIERIGSLYTIPIDIRIITATHKDLYLMVNQGEFRSDLFYRINVIPINIPPLRKRKTDIIILGEHFLKKCNDKLYKNVKGFNKEVRENFLSYDWPGNVRELENVIEYAVNMENSEYISQASLPVKFKEPVIQNHDYNLRQIEKRTIEEVIKKYKNRDEAAAVLGIGRATLFRKIKEL